MERHLVARRSPAFSLIHLFLSTSPRSKRPIACGAVLVVQSAGPSPPIMAGMITLEEQRIFTILSSSPFPLKEISVLRNGYGL
ncbi:MAG: hypothetical protein H6597_04150 [Flavobacteriales bacterium]|nr:hypothetical protein [Flavobacteriales bacterium]